MKQIDQLSLFGEPKRYVRHDDLPNKDDHDMTDEEMEASNEYTGEYHSKQEQWTKHIDVPDDPKVKNFPYWHPMPVITRERTGRWFWKEELYCRRCGYLVDLADNYCHHCGQRIENEDILMRFNNGEGYEKYWRQYPSPYSKDADEFFTPQIIAERDAECRARLETPVPIIRVTMFTKTSRKEYRCKCCRIIDPHSHGKYCGRCGRLFSDEIVHDEWWHDPSEKQLKLFDDGKKLCK